MSEPVHEFKEGQPVWVEDGDGKQHPGVFVGENQNASWFGGGPSAWSSTPRLTIQRWNRSSESRQETNGEPEESRLDDVAVGLGSELDGGA